MIKKEIGLLRQECEIIIWKEERIIDVYTTKGLLDDVIYDFNTLENETISLASAASQGVIVGVDKINSSWLLIKRNRVSNDYLYECSSLN